MMSSVYVVALLIEVQQDFMMGKEKEKTNQLIVKQRLLVLPCTQMNCCLGIFECWKKRV
jgi:hypothetical protein